MSKAIAKRSSPEPLMKVEQARALLAQCRSLDEAKSIRDKARAVTVYQRARGAGVASGNDAAEIVIRAERRLGELLADPELLKRAADGRPKKPLHDVTVSDPTLADLGIERISAHRWQKLAAIDEEALEAHIAVVRAGNERLTTSGTIAATSAAADYDSDEWYTPAIYVEAAREVMGGIDLDPASSAHAQKRIGALRWHTKADDGLAQEWHGRVWLNPPYSQPAAANFADKLLAANRSGAVTQAVMVQNSGTDTAWFHRMAAASWLCLVRGRINFDQLRGGSAANRYAQVFFYLGNQPERFVATFMQFGLVGRLEGIAE